MFPSPRPLPCINIYTRKGAGRWKHENDNKNSGKRLCARMTRSRRQTSPDLNLTPLAAFLRFCRSAKKRKKAARGVRFKSRLTPNMFRSRPSHSRLPLFHWYFCVSSCSFANISVGLLMWILYAFGTLEIEMSCYKIWSAKTLHALLCWVNYFLPIDAGYRRRTSIELLIQCHRLGLSCGRCSILTNFPSSDHAIPPVFVF